jgi:hypothetical protein
MSLLDPTEDFLARSVRKVGGKIARLAFVGRLRHGADDYKHWGMERMFGKDAAQSAIAQVHTTVWRDVLITRIQDLESDFHKEPETLIRGELRWDESVVPNDRGAGTKRHFAFLMKTLNLLLRHPR